MTQPPTSGGNGRIEVHFAPITGASWDADAEYVELLEHGAIDVLAPGSVLRCRSGLVEETAANRTIEDLHEKVVVDRIYDAGVPTLLVKLLRGAYGSLPHWHDRGCTFDLVPHPSTPQPKEGE